MSSRFGMRPKKRPAANRAAGREAGTSTSRTTARQMPGTTVSADILPRTPWWERFRPLFLREVATARDLKLAASISMWLLDADGTHTEERLIVSGRVRVKAARPNESEKWYGEEFDFSYPPDYPFDKLDVRPCDPRLRGRRHQTANGNLCYMQEELEPWVLGLGLERAIEGARDFLRAEITGRFEHEVPAAELIAYLPRDTEYVRAVLLPAHASWSEPPAASGRLTLEWDRWGEQPSLALFGAFTPAARGHDESTLRDANSRLWEALRLRRNPMHPNKYSAVDGFWFALDSEPHPFSDFAGLESLLRDHAGVSAEALDRMLEVALTRDVRERGWLPIALNYPRRVPVGVGAPVERQREWLFLNVEWPRLVEDRKRKRRLRASVFRPRLEVRAVPSYGVSPAELARRIGALYPHEPLARARVVIVGLGALGSTIARSLASAGVADFVLADSDVIKPGNVVRHEARIPDVGHAKVQAMAQILRETNPNVQVTTLLGTRANSAALEAVLLDAARRPSLVVAAVALKAVDGQIDEFARRASPPLPVLHAWVTAEAQVMRAFVTIAGRTACLYCNGLHERTENAAYVAAPEVDARPFFEGSCVDPAFPGAGNANALAAHVIAEMALDVLHDRLPDEESHWIFAGSRVRQVAPGFAVPPLTVVKRGFRPHPDCPICSTTELVAVHDPAQDEAFRQAVERLRETS